MWFGTNQGLSRFDGYRFVNFINNPTDTTSLKGNIVRVIFEDSKGRLLIGTEKGGLNIFDRQLEVFSHPYASTDEFRWREVSVNDIAEDQSGQLWLATDNGIIIVKNNELTTLHTPDSIKIEDKFIRNLKFDKSGNLWIGTNNGVFLYEPSSNHLEYFPIPFGSDQNREIWELFLDDDGSIWVGTYSSGIFIIDPVKRTLKTLDLNPDYRRTETVRSISKGIFGDYWIGTRGGLYIYSPDNRTSDFYRHDEREPRSLANNSVLDIFHDSNGETWIGTRGGLNLQAKSKHVFRNYSALPNDSHFLNSSIVYAIWMEESGKIWLGTEDGGVNIYDPRLGTYEYLTADSPGQNSVSQNCIKSFLDDRKGNLWIGTFLGGIDVINLRTKQFRHFKHDPDDPTSLVDNRVWDFCLDKTGRVWVATSAGVDQYNEADGTFTHYPQLAGNEQTSWIETDSENDLWIGSTSEVIIFDQESNTIKRFNEHSRSFFEDSQKRLWLATFDKGIVAYSKTDGPIQYYGQKDGLANNQALCILEDDSRNLWISTNNGLSKFNPDQNYFQNFTSKDGLRNNQFSYGAAFKSKTGQLLFGSIAGYYVFDPDDAMPEDTNVPIVLTDLRIFNKSVPINPNEKSLLKKSISETTELVLNYDQNFFTIEFAALNYVNSAGNMYSYYLEGFDKTWNEPSTIRSATYTNLNPDDYILKIKRVIPGMRNDDNILELKITIKPPFWKTLFFRLALLMVVLLLFYMLIRFLMNREKLKNELFLERMNARKIHELDMLKLRFFTNISHEIRTPLTLILAPLEKMIMDKIPGQEWPAHLNLVYRNAKQLDKLINQLLDFRKLETGNLKLNLTQSDIVAFVADVAHSFDDLAREKNITLRFNTLKKSLICFFDPDKIEKIINNLLSNAFKFTNPNGSITVNLSLVFDNENEDFEHQKPEKRSIEISVKDSGRGIESADIDKIFNRFFQSGKETDQTGTGIGLALVKELVKLHNGQIFVTSKPGKGSKFTLRIPFEPVNAQHESTADNGMAAKNAGLEDDIEKPEVPQSGLSKIMLVVEDNPDVRFFIRSHFKPTYQIIEASNGIDGWEKALKYIPNVIISDIMMPESDGYEFCKRIKKDERTSHIPVLLLTALHSREHELKGLSSGADDYITKPFDISVLQAKVENMLSVRESLKKKFTGTMVLEPRNVVISSPDERFLQRAIEAVEKNIADSDLDIEKFATEVGVSRMQLYRKLHALTDMTVKEFIRDIRLKRATQMLLQKKMNVSEIAFAVGFKDLSHFRKCFRREYGMSASEYVAKNPGSSGNEE